MVIFNYRKSLTKQILFLMFVILLIVLISFIITNKIAENIIQKKASDSVQKILLQVEDKSLSFYTDMDGISTSLIYSPTIQAFISNENVLDRILMNNDITSVFANTSSLKENVKGIQLYSKKGLSIANYGLGTATTSIDRNIRTVEYSGLLNLANGDRFKGYYSISVPIFNLKNNYIIEDYLGVCVFFMETGNFNKILKNSLISENSKLLILDKENNILASEGKIENKVFNVEKWEKDSHYIVQSLILPRSGWKLISIIPKADLLKDMSIVKWFSVVVYIILVIILCMILLIFLIKILKPVKELVDFMNSYTQRKRSSRYNVKYDNEIGVLGINLNKMLDDIDELTHKIYYTQNKMYEMELANKQMEILSYRNQINPHFLYNTLECIRAMAFFYNVNDIAEITSSLSNIFRYSVKGNDIVTISEEISHVREYAKIIEFRFMKRIQIQVNSQEDVLLHSIPKMIIQPIVENAVFHGLEKKIDQGIVNIDIKQIEQKRIQFVISDNGFGMEQEQLEKLLQSFNTNQQENSDKNNGIGLSNTYRRIKLYYGSDADFTIQSKLHSGTTIIISIPITDTNLFQKNQNNP